MMMNHVEIEKKLMKEKNITIFDVGAHHGYVSQDYKSIFPESNIYAFEPYEESFVILETNSRGTNIKPYKLALGDKNEKVKFYVNLADQTNSTFPTHDNSIKTWEGDYCITKEIRYVDMVTIDKFVYDNNIEKIDILKMDTQGSEYTVIEGAKNIIKQNKIKMVYTEIITMPTYIGQKHLDEIILLFRENGFSLYNLFNQSYTKDDRLRQIDAIFIHDSFY